MCLLASPAELPQQVDCEAGYMLSPQLGVFKMESRAIKSAYILAIQLLAFSTSQLEGLPFLPAT